MTSEEIDPLLLGSRGSSEGNSDQNPRDPDQNSETSNRNSLKTWFSVAALLLAAFCFIPRVISEAEPLYPQCDGAETTKPRVCDSVTCRKIAHSMKYIEVDDKVNECDDFWSFRCSRESYFISQLEKKKRIRRDLFGPPPEIEKFAKNIVNKKNRTTTTEVYRFWRGFYEKCLDYNTSYENYEEALKTITKSKGWPVPVTDSSWVEGEFDLTDTLIKMVEFGVTRLGIFNFNFGYSSEYYSVNSLYVQSSILLDKEVRGLSEKVAAHYKQLKNDRTDPDEIAEVIDLAKRVEYATFMATEKSLITNAKDWATLTDLEKWVPTVKWRELLSSVIPEDHYNMTINWDESVKVFPREYFENFLTKILVKSRPKALVALFHYVSAAGTLQLLPRTDKPKRNCEQILIDILPESVLSKLSSNSIDKNVVEGAMKLAEEVRQEFHELVMESDWMDEESRSNTVSKLEMMSISNTYDKEINVENYYKNRYRCMEVNKNETYLDLLLKTLKWKTHSYFLDIIEQEEVMVRNSNFDCYYEVFVDKFVIGTLGLNYELDVPPHLNYANLGYTYGLEMANMFWQRESMFTNETLRKFEEVLSCFEKNPIIPEQATLRNARMDVGLRISHRLNKKVEEQEKMKHFEHVDDDKMFFYSHAQRFCHESVYGNHTVNQFFSNYDGFAEAFKCRECSPMVRKNRCTVF